jgi:Spy/CpxP family protein refolding chaperone
MRKILLTSVLFVAVTSLLVAAQHENQTDSSQMVQHHVAFLTEQLSLSAQQQQTATTLMTEFHNNAKAVHEQLRTAQENLHSAIQKNDTAAIEQISNTIGNLTAQQTLAHAKAMATFYQTLTPEQQSKFAEIVHHGMGMHGHMMD